MKKLLESENGQSKTALSKALLSIVDWRSAELSSERSQDGSCSGGCFPAGNNGPYNDVETNYRNTAHWIIIYIAAWKLTDELKYFEIANAEVDYILRNSPRHKYPYECRESVSRDATNGVIGQAWIAEGLIYAWKHMDRADALLEAERLYEIHEFNSSKNAWHTVNADGSIGKIDGTFNHQLWFAAIASMLPYSERRDSEIRRFLSVNGLNPQLNRDSIIFHNTAIGEKGFLKLLISNPRKQIRKKLKEILDVERSIAYHCFNLYAYAMLAGSRYRVGSLDEFFGSEKFANMVSAIKNPAIERGAFNSKYGATYNPVGFELCYVKRAFPALIEIPYSELVGKQLQVTRNVFSDSGGSKMIVDKVTLASRYYELAKVFLDF